MEGESGKREKETECKSGGERGRREGDRKCVDVGRKEGRQDRVNIKVL